MLAFPIYYNFHCKGLSSLWLNLFPGFSLFCNCDPFIVNETVLLISISVICYWHIATWLISVCWFCILQVYWMNLLVLVVLWWSFWGFPRQCKRLCQWQTLTIWFLFFPQIWMPFISFFCLISLARISSTISNKSGHSFLFQILDRNHSTFPHSVHC